MDGDFPWILVGAFLLWIFNLLAGRKRTRIERPQLPRDPRHAPPVERRPEPTRGGLDPTQTEGGRLEELLRALEQRLDPTAGSTTPRPQPRQTQRGPLGRPSTRPLPTAEETEERGSLEVDPVVETLEGEVRRPERVAPNRLAQAEAKERARLAQAEARDRESHKSRHSAFDKRIRTEPTTEPAARRLTTAQLRQAFIWGEILSRPRSEQ